MAVVNLRWIAQYSRCCKTDLLFNRYRLFARRLMIFVRGCCCHRLSPTGARQFCDGRRQDAA